MIRYFYYQLRPQTATDDFLSILQTSMLTYEHVYLSPTTGYLVAEDDAAIKLQQSLSGLLLDIDFGAAFMIAGADTSLTRYALTQLHLLVGKQIWYEYEMIWQLWKHDDTQCMMLLRSLFDRLTREELETLLVFTQNTGNAIKASEQLYVHRNTLHYRMNQIHDKTGFDFRDFLTIQLFAFYASIMNLL